MQTNLARRYSGFESLLCTPDELKQKRVPNQPSAGKVFGLVDLFSGCGGLTLGVVQALVQAQRRVQIRWALDCNASALRVYADNFSRFASSIDCNSVERYLDVSSIKATPTRLEARALSKFSGVDLIIAGPPCQGHSDLNNSSRRSDPRNLLYLAPVRAALCLRPKVVLIENVPTVTKAAENVVERARETLARAGYYVREYMVDLVDFGVPQTRSRHIQLASRFPLESFSDELAALPEGSPCAIDFIRDLQDEASEHGMPFVRTTKVSSANRHRIDYLFAKGLYDLPNRLRPACHRDRMHSYVSMYGRMHPHKPAQTITSGFGSMGQGRFVHPTRPRMITAHEAARLQGFPDYFSFAECHGVTHLREMIGNAVPPPLSKMFTSLLLQHGHLE